MQLVGYPLPNLHRNSKWLGLGEQQKLYHYQHLQ